jgi:pyruvate dehydrogenase E2 component (dihydrolipoamide acetyltransferase)
VAGEQGVAGVILAPTSPRVRRLARERDLDLDAVRGTGPRGRVTEGDLDAPQAAAVDREAARAAALAAVVGPGDTVLDASPMRRTIARRLTEAKQTVPHFYLEADLDVEALAALRAELNAAAESPEAKVSFNDLLVRASALALRAVPESNASWIDGKVVRYGRVDISVAVAIDDGLVTPVVRDADKLSVGQIARVVKELAGRARARKLKPEEMQRGTFSVSNLGMFGIDRFAAVINPPEGMILAVGSVRDVPVVKGGAVVPGKRCAVTLSCDHRVVDGALGARFLQALRTLVEQPLRILV